MISRPVVLFTLLRSLLGCGVGWLALAAVTVQGPRATAAETPLVADPANSTALRAKEASVDTALAALEARHAEAYRLADYTAAIATAREGLALADASQAPRAPLPFLRHLAYDYWLMGESDLAMDYAHRLIDTAETLGDRLALAQGHRYLSIIYAAMGDFARARPQAETTLRLAEAAGEPTLIASAKQDVAINQAKAGDLAAARRTYEEVVAFWEKQGNRWNAFNTRANLADLAEQQGDLPAALELYEKIYAARIELGDRRGQVRALSALAGLLLKLNRADDALARLEIARPLAESIGGHRLLAEFYGVIARTEEARRNFGAALAAERLATAAREQYAGERARLRASDLAERLNAAEKQQAIDLLVRQKVVHEADLRAKEAELAHSRFLRYALIDGLLVIGVVLATVVFVQRTRLRAERRILEETKTAKVAAEKADLAKTRFLAVASHEIRAPLGNVINLLSGLRAPLKQSGEAVEQIDLITAETQRVLAFVEDLVTTAAIDGDQLKLRPAPCDLIDVVRAVVGTMQWQADAKTVKFVFPEPAPGVGVITGDAGRLYQALSNVIGNAIKYSAQGKTVALSLVRDGHFVTFAVTDEGPGIADAEASRLFTPFERLSAKPTGGETSHGLGLSIAHEIVRLHGGTIQVASRPGTGSTFTIALPVGPTVNVEAG